MAANSKGSVAAELAILRKAADCGFPLVDLELQSAEALKADELQRSLRPRRDHHLAP